MTESNGTVTVFGGTGFLGCRIARRLATGGWRVRVAVRRPERFDGQDHATAVRADVQDEASVAAAVEGAQAVVNAVSLYWEKGAGQPSFRSVHEEGAARVARIAATGGARRLVHISGIGADTGSPSRFIAARGRGEKRVMAAFDGATIVRPSVMFGDDDRFLNSLADILRRSPVFPLIGGTCRLQPVAADDVAAAVDGMLHGDRGGGETFELGGPEILTLRDIVERLRDALRLRRPILPVPIRVALLQAYFLELLPTPPLTVAQVELLRHDNVARPAAPGFEGLGIRPMAIAEALPGRIRSPQAAKSS